jgi:uncharacterized protein (TIGR02466 family)
MSTPTDATIRYVVPQRLRFRTTPAGGLQVERGSESHGAESSPLVSGDLLPLLLLFTRPQSLASALGAAPAGCHLEPDALALLVQKWVAAGLLQPVAPSLRPAESSRLAMFQAAAAQHDAAPAHPFPLSSPFELQRPALYYPGLGTREIHDARRFAWVPLLEDAFPAIRGELLALLDHARFAQVYKGYTAAGEWNAAYLWIFGNEIEETTRLCPQTAAVLRHIPGVTAFGTSLFLALAPGTFLAPHCGSSNAKLRCQLPLVVPPGCRLKVGDTEVEQREGRCIVFDDSFLHSAWNSSDQVRYVLLFDFYHPDLDDVEIAYLAELAAKKNLARPYLKQVASRGPVPSEDDGKLPAQQGGAAALPAHGHAPAREPQPAQLAQPLRQPEKTGAAGDGTPTVQLLFGAPVLSFLWQEAEAMNRDLRRLILSWREHRPSVRMSNAGGWQSAKDLQTVDDPAVRELLVKIDIGTYMISSECFGEDELIAAPKWHVAAWANVNEPGDYNLPHTHSGGVWSGVYYVDPGYDTAPEDLGGAISFANPTMAPLVIDNLRPPGFVRQSYQRDYSVCPQSGQMILFPSWLEHYVHPHRGERPRISISWDVHFTAPPANART